MKIATTNRLYQRKSTDQKLYSKMESSVILSLETMEERVVQVSEFITTRERTVFVTSVMIAGCHIVALILRNDNQRDVDVAQ